MSTPHEDSDHIEDPRGDGQLTIRIPNPKVYMARQSRWVGHRGKPRCDHCRIGNLKCDRGLPICNHCSWANHKDCSYTPLPTPAHRGIPRCDRCRSFNLKCDRNLPICNNCKEGGDVTSCNYTPKKRHRRTDEEPASPVTPVASSSKKARLIRSAHVEHAIVKIEPVDEPMGGHSFYGQNVGRDAPNASKSPAQSGTETPSDPDSKHTGRFTADFAKPATKETARLLKPLAGGVLSPRPSSSSLEIIPHTFPVAHHKILIVGSHIDPWRHPAFIPLPPFVCQSLSQVDPVEMPKRTDFENSLLSLQRNMMEAIKETAVLSVDKYIKLSRALQTGDASNLSGHLHTWTVIHRFCSGSDKYSVILVPRDSVFDMDAETAAGHRRQFIHDLLSGTADEDSLQVHHYDRIPVFNQIYDILTYAHRSHLPAAQMLLEAVRLRFATITWPMAELYVRLCPVCIMRSKAAAQQKEAKSSTVA